MSMSMASIKKEELEYVCLLIKGYILTNVSTDEHNDIKVCPEGVIQLILEHAQNTAGPCSYLYESRGADP